ncbi:MAG: anthrone oxygenase family protein [Pseudomonadota bacterium]
MSTAFFVFAQLAVIAYAAVGGVFLAFSDFIMRSLARTGGDGGIDAMQTINREVFRWVFMAMFLGLAAVSLLLMAIGLTQIGGIAGVQIALAGLAYVVGCFLVTVVFNVPMNETLARMNLSSTVTRDYWTGTYLPRWTFWNTVRAGACMVAAGLLLLGLTGLVRLPGA